MKKNLYYRSVFKRTNKLKETFLNFFLAFCSWPRLLIEVVIRRNFGERYFSFSACLLLAFLIALYPPAIVEIQKRMYALLGMEYTWLNFLYHQLTLYLYLIGFVYMSIKRRNEIKRLPSVFDFARFSLSAGEIHPYFLNFHWKGKKVSMRTIETKIEPGVFFLAGLGLYILGQTLGGILMYSAIFYSLSYKGAYRQGDHFIMDKIDEMICNEEMVKAFVEGRDANETRGVNFYGRKPADPETRRKLIDTFIGDEPVEAF